MIAGGGGSMIGYMRLAAAALKLPVCRAFRSDGWKAMDGWEGV